MPRSSRFRKNNSVASNSTPDNEVPNEEFTTSSVRQLNRSQQTARDVATVSIQKFARSSNESVGNISSHSLPISSTPTGITPAFSVSAADEGEEHHWPGPFSTARAMINKREQAKKDRLANIAQNQEGVATATATAAESESESIPDEYEIILQSIRDSPHEGCKPPLRPVASLQDILLEFLVFRWDRISDLGLGDLSGDMREQLCTRLGTRRLLSHETVLSLSSRGSGALSLSECSELSEDTIIKVLEKTCSLDTDPLSVSLSASLAEKEKDREKKGGRRKREREEEDEGPALFLSPLHSLTLRNCGHGFGDRAALTLAHLGDPEKGPGLESLSQQDATD
eukprot:CAMPEP_0182421658 /NCGR_PEP_ID=MMETSP1167-20130531/7090_1 /TAXON_ID=2988 /ORGANISM="Mallomonas Sp, Strain CCMP3275" /LENGTH=339 /DNA_ID=CAMNT_0024598989 /DNA_START=68 /DNA_END=1088 /DNA_ORIENTATION=+